jgi:hypothetical protein
MRKMGFANGWVRLIMECMPLVSYKVKDNDSYTHRFFFTQRLKTGRSALTVFVYFVCRRAISYVAKSREGEEDNRC